MGEYRLGQHQGPRSSVRTAPPTASMSRVTWPSSTIGSTDATILPPWCHACAGPVSERPDALPAAETG
jgi:hypothetical protein